MGILFVYSLFLISCLTALSVPALGCAAFYFFNLLDPAWNWRWDIPQDPGFQKWLAIALLLGFIAHHGWRSAIDRTSVTALGLLLGFVLLCYTSSVFSAYPDKSALYLDMLWRIALIVAVSFFVIVDEDRAMIMAIGCVVGQAYNSFQINLEYFQLGYCRYASITDWGFKGLDNNGYSILTIPVLALSIAIVVSPWKWWIRSLAGAIVLLQLHQLMLMESRGSMLGAMLTAAIAVWYCPKTLMTNTILLLGCVLITFLAGPPVVREFASAFADEGSLDVSAESRFHLWKAGAAIIWDYPVLGVGPGCSGSYVPLYYHYELLKAENEKALHNVFFEVMCENGVLAGTMFLMFFALLWGKVWLRRRIFFAGNPRQCTLALAVIAGIPGYFLASMFSSGTLIESSYMLPIMAGALLGTKPKDFPIEKAEIAC